MTSLTIAYTPQYLDWQLGEGHPTDPRRAKIATTKLGEWAKARNVDIRWVTPELDWPSVETQAARAMTPATSPTSDPACAANGPVASRASARSLP